MTTQPLPDPIYAVACVAIRSGTDLRIRLSYTTAVSEEEAVGKGWIWARGQAPASERWHIMDVVVLHVPHVTVITVPVREKEDV